MFQVLLPLALASTRGEFIAALKARGIGIGVHYQAMHLSTLFRAARLAQGRVSRTPSASARAP